MTTIDTTTREKDFYAQLMVEIDAGNIDRAVEMVMGVKGFRLQIDMLRALALVRELTGALDRAHAHALDYARARDLARDLDSTLALALARAHPLALAFANALAYDLARALALARARGRVVVINRTIIACLEVLAGNRAFLDELHTQLTLTGIDTLTPRHLANTVAPYLQAIFDMQATLLKITRAKYVEPRVSWISQNSPVEIKLVDIAETVETIRDWIVPWRRENAKTLAVLAAEKQRLDNEQVKVALQKAKLELIDMALAIVDKHSPGLPENQRFAFAMELIPSINTLAVDSPVQITDISKPRTLPP